jgi:hypothetical protein
VTGPYTKDRQIIYGDKRPCPECQKPKKWEAIVTAERVRHVIPLADTMTHVERCDCWCRPSCVDGIYAHHSLDGREYLEYDFNQNYQEHPNA